MLVGIVGLGEMGGGMARRLLGRGRRVVGFDLDSSALADFVQHGGLAAASPRGVADQAEVVLASLPTLAASQAVALADDGVVHGRAIKTYVETSTIGPAAAQRLCRELLATSNIAFLDVPVSGGHRAAQDGTLTAVAAGGSSPFARVSPLLREIATNVLYISDVPGQAQVYKLVNNYIVMNAIAVTCEAVAVGVRAGADEKKLLEVINHCTGRNFATTTYFPSILLPQARVGSLTMALKDVELFAQYAQELGVNSETANLLVRIWRDADAAGQNILGWYQALRDK